MQPRNIEGKNKIGHKLAAGYFKLKTYHPVSGINFRFQIASGGKKKKKKKKVAFLYKI